MNLLPPLLGLAALAFEGCIIYDGDCKNCDPDGSSRNDRHDDTSSGSDTDTADSKPPEPVFSYVMTPDHGEAGQAFIASLRSTGEAPPYTEISEIDFYGPLQVLASDVRSWEYLFAVSILPEAEPTTVDAVVVFSDGDTWLGDDLFTVFAAGTGNGAQSSDDGSDPCAD
jgi:hypothetical protein